MQNSIIRFAFEKIFNYLPVDLLNIVFLNDTTPLKNKKQIPSPLGEVINYKQCEILQLIKKLNNYDMTCFKEISVHNSTFFLVLLIVA